ncbi:MAG: F0F1 ATP synthase subunit epsilon [Muribaculaceae bacterium]|nr:F0F1 ATP synthase subunit epsilon [Muribaculaceae bacterium]
MTLEIISPSEILFKGDAEAVTLPGVMGSFTVLKNHASLISVLKSGSIIYKSKGGEEISVDIKGGLVDVDNNVVSVCVY